MHEILIDTNASLTFIYADDMADLIADSAKPVVCRVSNVEPHHGGWRVEMIGDDSAEAFALASRTFRLRADALAAEVEYLRNKLFT